jgi:hypothetical protein
VFDPSLGTGPGRLFIQSLWVQFPRAKSAHKNKQREKIPRRVVALIAGKNAKSRQSQPKFGQVREFSGILGRFIRSARP